MKKEIILSTIVATVSVLSTLSISHYLREDEINKVTKKEAYNIWKEYAIENNIKFTDDFEYFGSDGYNISKQEIKVAPPTVSYPNKNPKKIYMYYSPKNKESFDLSGFDSIKTIGSLNILFKQNGVKYPDYFKGVKDYSKIYIEDNNIKDLSGLSHLVNIKNFDDKTLIIYGRFYDTSIFKNVEKAYKLFLYSPNIDISGLSNLKEVKSLGVGSYENSIKDITPLKNTYLEKNGGHFIGNILGYSGPRINKNSVFCMYSVKNLRMESKRNLMELLPITEEMVNKMCKKE